MENSTENGEIQRKSCETSEKDEIPRKSCEKSKKDQIKSKSCEKSKKQEKLEKPKKSEKPKNKLKDEMKPLPEIGTSPHQPGKNYPFKKTKIGDRIRFFKHEWLAEFDWIHYDGNLDKAYCYTCIKCIKEKKCSIKHDSNPAWTHNGFDQWNKGSKIEKQFSSLAEIFLHKK